MGKMTFRHKWTLAVVQDRELSTTTRLLGVAVAMKYGRPHAGQAFFPSYKTAGAFIGRSEAVGKRAILALRDRGWLKPDGHSSLGTVRYVPIMRDNEQVTSDLMAAEDAEVNSEGNQITSESSRSFTIEDQVASDLQTDVENRSISTDPENPNSRHVAQFTRVSEVSMTPAEEWLYGDLDEEPCTEEGHVGGSTCPDCLEHLEHMRDMEEQHSLMHRTD